MDVLTIRGLKQAATSNDLPTLRELLRAGAAPDAVAVKGDATALILACDSGHIDSARLLIDAGADVNFQNEIGDSPLVCAVAIGRPDLVALLLENGAVQVSSLRFKGEKTLIEYAEELGNLEIIQLLREKAT